MADKVLSVLNKICENTKPGKKVVQKLFYLIERKGLDLGLDYVMHYYGPYSSELDQKLRVCEDFDCINIDTSGMAHTISIADSFKSTENPFADDESQVIDNIIKLYACKSPLDLELLTTTDYVANSILSNIKKNEKNIIDGVKEIKGEKFSVEKIQQSISELTNQSFISLNE